MRLSFAGVAGEVSPGDCELNRERTGEVCMDDVWKRKSKAKIAFVYSIPTPSLLSCAQGWLVAGSEAEVATKDSATKNPSATDSATVFPLLLKRMRRMCGI